MKLVFVVLLNVLAVFSGAKADACGGLLESDAGEFELPRGLDENGDLECVWVIQLVSRQTINFTLNRLDSSSATVNVYPEHDVTETVLTPIRLSISDVGQPIQAAGQTLVIVLTRPDFSSGLSFSWDSIAATSTDVLTAANYVDIANGRVQWNRFSRKERLTWALNLDSDQSLALKAQTEFERCDLLNPCQCSYFGLYEIASNGDLREVTRVCGRSSSFETEELSSKLLAFVYINSTQSVEVTDHVELSWLASNIVAPTERPEPTEVTWEPTTIEPIISEGCGEIISLPPHGSSMRLNYTSNQTEGAGLLEQCLWTLELTNGTERLATQLKYRLVSGDFDVTTDSLTVVEWGSIDKYLQSQNLNFGSDYTSFAFKRVSFLSYQSSRRSTNKSFVIEVQVTYIGGYPGSGGSNSLFTSAAGSALYELPVGYSYDYTTIAIAPSPGKRTDVTVHYVDSSASSASCEEYDSVDFIEIGPRGTVSLLGRLCEGVPSPTYYSSEYPVLALFQWDEGSSGRGVSLSWQKH